MGVGQEEWMDEVGAYGGEIGVEGVGEGGGICINGVICKRAIRWQKENG